MKQLFKYNTFTLLSIFLVVTLPFYVLIQVFFKFKLGIPYFGIFIKEGILVALGLSLIYELIKSKTFPKIDILDILILGYICYGIGITLYQGFSVSHLFYGGRYDFVFFITLFIFKHGKQFIQLHTSKLLHIFLISASISLFFSLFVKFLIGERALIMFGFSDYSSSWTFNGSIPTHHGLENSGIKRFQGIFDSPSAMGYFLIIFGSLYLESQREKIQFHNFLLLSFLFILIILTFSRSALLGVGVALGTITLLHIKDIYKKYRKPFLYSIIIILSIIFLSLIIFQERMYNAVIRPSSTAGHFSRMDIGIERFKTEPFGQGLATSGPAFRNVYEGKITKAVEEYYIPESWFVQQLVEGGFIYFSLFILIFTFILLGLFQKSKPLFAGLVAILIMNVFLHIFEATYLSILMFLFIGLYLSSHSKKEMPA